MARVVIRFAEPSRPPGGTGGKRALGSHLPVALHVAQGDPALFGRVPGGRSSPSQRVHGPGDGVEFPAHGGRQRGVRVGRWVLIGDN